MKTKFTERAFSLLEIILVITLLGTLATLGRRILTSNSQFGNTAEAFRSFLQSALDHVNNMKDPTGVWLLVGNSDSSKTELKELVLVSTTGTGTSARYVPVRNFHFKLGNFGQVATLAHPFSTFLVATTTEFGTIKGRWHRISGTDLRTAKTITINLDLKSGNNTIRTTFGVTSNGTIIIQ